MRVTIDIDEKNWLRAYSVWSILNYICMGLGCTAYIRETRKGYHVKAHGLPIDYLTSIRMREILGDDTVRLKIDLHRIIKPRQVLWSWKKLNGETQIHGVWRRMPWALY